MTALRSLLTGSLLIAVLAACAGGTPAASITPPPEADLTVKAEGNAFDTDTITLTAGEATTLFFTNLDGQPHNIAIYADDTAEESLFVGEVITATDDAITYEIPALEPGEYFFRCDVHPDKTRTVVVEA